MAHHYRSEREGWPVGVNVRLRRIAPLDQPDDDAAIRVLESLAHGHVPAGWEVAAVSWQGYVRAGRRWTPGQGSEYPDPPDYAPAGRLGVPAAMYGGWRSGDVSDLAPLMGPILAGDVSVGWEKRERTVREVIRESWWRWRLKHGERSRRYRPGEWVSNEYAARYPWKCERGEGERERVITRVVTDWEAEVRVSYMPRNG